MRTITFDIETVKSQREDIRALIEPTIKPPGTLKKAESIAKWELEERPGAIDEAVDKTVFDGAFGQVVCIGWAIDDEPARWLHVANLSPEAETDLLQRFWSEMQREHSGSSGSKPVLVGFNHVAFDIPFLYKRSVVRNVRPPFWWPRNPKPWSESVFDVMTAWAGDRDRISLDRLAKALNMEGKGSITGADVWPMVQAGKYQEVAEYCAADVELTRQVFKRLTFA